MKSWHGQAALAAGVIVTAITITGGCNVVSTGVIGDITDDFLVTGRTASFFRAIQVDPRSEDSAGPQFVASADLNGDGLMDLVSAWNQSQPVQIHLQRRSAIGVVSFENAILAGGVPVVSVAGLEVADFDQDGVMDVAVLVKQSLLSGPGCLNSDAAPEGLSGAILVYFGPADTDQTAQALAWEEVLVGTSFLQGTGLATLGAEFSGFTAMVTGDMDNDGDTDIVAAWNSGCGEGALDAVVFTNNGPGPSRDGTWTAAAIPDSLPRGTHIKSVAVGDVDNDGDLDVVATFPDAPTSNVRWYRNPAVDTPDDVHISDGKWQTGTIGHIATGADIVKLGDIDGDDILDAAVRSSLGLVIQWFKGPADPTTAPVRAVPWQVFTLAEYTERVPESIALGDLNGDGQLELIAAAEGGLTWFNSQTAPSLYDQWRENTIIDDRRVEDEDSAPATTDPNVTGEEVGDTTIMNTLLVTDLDGDGQNDLIVTLDRVGLSGLTNDALVWFRNTR